MRFASTASNVLAPLLVVKDNIEVPIFQGGSDEVCECQVFGILQDLFQEETMVHSVSAGGGDPRKRASYPQTCIPAPYSDAPASGS